MKYSQHYTNSLLKYSSPSQLSWDSYHLHSLIKDHGEEDKTPILADSLEEQGEHGNEETLKHLRSGMPVYTTEHEGKVYAYPKEAIHDFVLKGDPYSLSTIEESDEQDQPLTHHSILKGLEGGNHSFDLHSALSAVNNATHHTGDDPPRNKLLIDLSDKLADKLRAKTEDQLTEENAGFVPNHYKWETHPDQVFADLYEHYMHDYSDLLLSPMEIRNLVHDNWKSRHTKTPLNKQIPKWEKMLHQEHLDAEKSIRDNTEYRNNLREGY